MTKKTIAGAAARPSRLRFGSALALGAFLLSLLPAAGMAAPVAPDELTPMDFRRASLVVRDIDESLKIYRDALGMEVIYDKEFLTPRDAKSQKEATRHQRLVFLRANDTYIGVLGLLQYLKPKLKNKRLRKPQKPFLTFENGDTVLVFNTRKGGGLGSREAIRKALKVKGTRLITPPVEVTYPRYDDKGVIRVLVGIVRDPDGYMLEINEVLSDLGMKDEGEEKRSRRRSR